MLGLMCWYTAGRSMLPEVFLPEASLKLWVLSLPTSVCVFCVCVCVRVCQYVFVSITNLSAQPGSAS